MYLGSRSKFSQEGAVSGTSGRKRLATAASTGILGAHTTLPHAQAPAAAPADLDADGTAALRVSQDLAMLLQVQLMIGTSVDYEYPRMFDSFTDLNIRVSASPAASNSYARPGRAAHRWIHGIPGWRAGERPARVLREVEK